MKFKFVFSQIVFISCLFASACEKADVDYFPLESDQEWQYNLSITTMDGTRNQKYLQYNFPEFKLEDQTVWPKQIGDGSKIFYTLTEEGVFRFGTITNAGQKISENPPSPVLIYPLEVGTSWQKKTTTFLLEKSGPPQDTLFRISEPLLMNHQIVSTDEIVTVPAGRFERCLKIEAKGQTSANVGNYIGKIDINVQQTFWYAPDRGLIKSLRVETTNNPSLNRGEYLMELEK
ncbi:MAG: hypothetical protein AB8D52_06420 [Gammaproteobacteria bacterium]